jgi:dethiobiotin synthetase
VGKTTVAAALVRRLRALGHAAIGVKPIETGCAYGPDQDLVGADGGVLHAAAHRSVPPLVVSPYRVPVQADPAEALERAGIELGLEDLVGAIDAAAGFGDVLVVEGTGGALAPLTTDALGLDLAERVAASLVIAAPDEAGIASQVILILEAARRRALNIAGVVLSRLDERAAVREEDGASRAIRERGGAQVFARVPWIAGDEKERIFGVEAHFAANGIAEAILDAAARP